jgi:hypothetical protein
MREKNKLSGFFMLIIFAALLLAASQAGAMRFSHVVHDKNEISQCTRCHTPGAVSIIPARAVCYECHEEKEIEETVLGPIKSHTPVWVRQHGIDSQSAGAQCSKCHSISFCVDCHKGGELGVDLQKRAVRLDTVPSTHTSRFRIVHPLKATAEQIQKCYTCHSKSDCVDCHESYRNRFPGREIVSHQMNWEQLIDHATFPLNQCQDCHPGGALSSADWSQGHAKEARRSLSSCQSCHPDGDACLDCHSATTGLMISPHPGNWGRIQSKFRKESPEVCAKCH